MLRRTAPGRPLREQARRFFPPVACGLQLQVVAKDYHDPVLEQVRSIEEKTKGGCQRERSVFRLPLEL